MSYEMDMDPIVLSLRDSYIETAMEKLDSFDTSIDILKKDFEGSSEAMTAFRGDVHSLKGVSGTFGFPLISVICHRLEEYIQVERPYSREEFEHIQVFSDQMRTIVEQRENPNNDISEQILAELPTPNTAFIQPQKSNGLKVVLVSPMAALRQMAEFYLSDLGCQITATESPIEAFRFIVEQRPDLIITSVQMQQLSGIDLGRAVSEISFLKTTKIALMTSSADVGDLSRGIPDKFLAIRTDQLEDDISEAIESMISADIG